MRMPLPDREGYGNATGTGANRVVVVPSPSAPSTLSPQQAANFCVPEPKVWLPEETDWDREPKLWDREQPRWVREPKV